VLWIRGTVVVLILSVLQGSLLDCRMFLSIFLTSVARKLEVFSAATEFLYVLSLTLCIDRKMKFLMDFKQIWCMDLGYIHLFMDIDLQSWLTCSLSLVISLYLCAGLKYCESLYLGSIVTSWLNPLRVCMPHIVTKFASVVRSDVVYGLL